MKIQMDKKLHFVACFIPSLFGLYGACFAAGLGIGKEYGDMNSPGNKWDWQDIVADVAGILCGLFIHYLLF